MSLDRLLYECTVHYRDRGYPESALLHLRWTLVSNTHGGQICFQTAYAGCHRRVEDLLGHFKPCPSAPNKADLASASAVFGFAFGYRMRCWSEGTSPTDADEVFANRLAGANNEALAQQCRQLHSRHGLDLYLQFEIADAIGTGTPVEYASRRVDQGTRAVLDEFVSHAKNKGKTHRLVVVVAHRHHFDRCRILVVERDIEVLRPPELYSGYDPLEAQPRAMTPEESIVNDFASMAGMAERA